MYCDLSNLDEVKNLENELDKYDIKFLINNAGIGNFGYFFKNNFDIFLKVIQVNITALTSLSNYFLKRYSDTKKDRYLINISSIGALTPGPLMSVYYASKSYVTSFTHAIIEENKNTKMHISVAHPGPTKTNFIKSNSYTKFSNTPEYVANMIVQNVLKNKTNIYLGKYSILAFFMCFLPLRIKRKLTYFQLKKKGTY